jgi:hypothetical protein
MFFICWFTGPPTWNSGKSEKNKNWDLKKNLKKKRNTPQIRFFHLKMQHDDSKCPKFSSPVEIEYKRLTYKDTIVTSKKVTKPNPFDLHTLFVFFSIYFLFFSDHPTILSGGQQIINLWPNKWNAWMFWVSGKNWWHAILNPSHAKFPKFNQLKEFSI